MRQLFKRTRVFLLPLLVLLAVPAEGFGQWGRAWSEKFDTIPGARGGWWNSFGSLDDQIKQDWIKRAAEDSKWHTNEDCSKALDYVLDALASANLQQGIGTFAGEYFGPLEKGDTVNSADIIVVHGWALFGVAGFETLIHEAWHRSTGWTDLDIDTLNTRLMGDSDIGRPMEECYDEERKEEEEEEEEEKPTKPTDEGGGDPEPVCGPKEVKETYTDMVLERRTAQVCFPWDLVGANFCVDIVLEEYVPVEKVRWVTKTVCEN